MKNKSFFRKSTDTNEDYIRIDLVSQMLDEYANECIEEYKDKILKNITTLDEVSKQSIIDLPINSTKRNMKLI